MALQVLFLPLISSLQTWQKTNLTRYCARPGEEATVCCTPRTLGIFQSTLLMPPHEVLTPFFGNRLDEPHLRFLKATDMVLESGNSSLTTTYIRRVECTTVTRTKVGAEKEMQRVFKERKGDLDVCASARTYTVCNLVVSHAAACWSAFRLSPGRYFSGHP